MGAGHWWVFWRSLLLLRPRLYCQLQTGQFRVDGGGRQKASALIWATGHGSATTSGPIRTSIGSGNTWALSSRLLIDGRGNALPRPSCSTRWDEGSACLADYDDPAPLVGAIG